MPTASHISNNPHNTPSLSREGRGGSPVWSPVGSPDWVSKLILSQILITAFLFYPMAAYHVSPLPTGEGSGVRLLSLFSHANIFHLLGNLLCLWLMKCRFRLPQALGISFVCSFLPQWSLWGSTNLACGFSAVLFAVAGMAWGEAGHFRDMVKKCVLPLVIVGLFPNVNIFIHLYALLLGYAYQSVKCSAIASSGSKFFTLHYSLFTSR